MKILNQIMTQRFLEVFLKGFKFQIDQKFLNNNALIYNGNISFEEKTFINGTINSSKLDLDEVLVILSKFQSLKKNFILAKSSFNKDIEANFLVNIEEIFLKKRNSNQQISKFI